MKSFLIAALVLTVGCQEKPAAPQRVVSAVPGVRTIDIKVSGGEYQPASVTVKRGEPIRLNFTRDQKITCGDVLVIPSLNIKEEIPVNQVVSIDITPDKTGDLEFTCGMNMMKGKVVVQ